MLSLFLNRNQQIQTLEWHFQNDNKSLIHNTMIKWARGNEKIKKSSCLHMKSMIPKVWSRCWKTLQINGASFKLVEEASNPCGIVPQIGGRSLESMRYCALNWWRKPSICAVLCLKSVEGVTTRCNKPQIGERSHNSLWYCSNRCKKSQLAVISLQSVEGF